MQTNNSPWLQQLNRKRPLTRLDTNLKADVAIVGGGIAGIATTYYTLKNTKKSVALVEAGKVAHGATGHNGGFLASYFERTFSNLVQEFGLKKAAEGQLAMESTWQLLDEIRADAKLQTPVWQFTGFAACANIDEILVHLRNSALRLKAGLPSSTLLVSDKTAGLAHIPKIYKNLYTLLPKKEILSLLETEDKDYVAILPERKGCMNSALFCEELVGHLLAKYKNRFTLAESAPVKKLELTSTQATLCIENGKLVTARRVVLCTNGFEKVNIVNLSGEPINAKFHHLVRGIVGYMAGYTETQNKPPIEISYLPKKSAHGKDVYAEEPYFYLTRRPYESETNTQSNLVCIGGPEALMDDTNNYHLEHPFPREARQQIDDFVRFTYKHDLKDKISYKFLWHGLMGFTPNGVRLIGPEPLNPILLYNLGCNGVGLLPSIYGGQKISWHLAGKNTPPSIFDPQNQPKNIAKNILSRFPQVL